MSGPLTVPFAILAIWLEQTWQKTLFVVLAILAASGASYVLWRAERQRANSLQVEIDRLNAFDIDAHMIEPLILFSDSAAGRRFVLIPNVHFTSRSLERTAVEVSLRIYPTGSREFLHHCPPMLTATSEVQDSVQAAPVWQKPIVFGSPLGIRFDMEPRATVTGSLVFEITSDRGVPRDLTRLKSVPMAFHFRDHSSAADKEVPITHVFHGPGGSGEWPTVEAPLISPTRLDSMDAEWLSVECGSVVIIQVSNPFGAYVDGPHIESGVYIAIEDTRLQNKMGASVSLVPKLRRRLDDKEWSYEAKRMPERVGNVLTLGPIIFYLSDNFAPVIPLDGRHGDARRLMFRTGAKVGDIQKGELTLEMRDLLAERPTISKPIAKPEAGWRVHA
jgi:hypothetical protein